MASRSLFLLGVRVQSSVTYFFFYSCVMLSDGRFAPVCDTRESISRFKSVSPPLCCFCRLRFFCCRPDLRFLKATSQFSWFVSSAPERATVPVCVFLKIFVPRPMIFFCCVELVSCARSGAATADLILQQGCTARDFLL
jgi:hypothetical protein